MKKIIHYHGRIKGRLECPVCKGWSDIELVNALSDQQQGDVTEKPDCVTQTKSMYHDDTKPNQSECHEFVDSKDFPQACRVCEQIKANPIHCPKKEHCVNCIDIEGLKECKGHKFTEPKKEREWWGDFEDVHSHHKNTDYWIGKKGTCPYCQESSSGCEVDDRCVDCDNCVNCIGHKIDCPFIKPLSTPSSWEERFDDMAIDFKYDKGVGLMGMRDFIKDLLAQELKDQRRLERQKILANLVGLFPINQLGRKNNREIVEHIKSFWKEMEKE